MTKNTTATQSLTKKSRSRGKSDAAPRANRGHEPNPERQPGGSGLILTERQIARDGSSCEAPKRASKQDQLAALLVRDEGATIPQMTDATAWLPHTVRSALTGLKKKGYAIDSDKVGKVRTYRATAPQ